MNQNDHSSVSQSMSDLGLIQVPIYADLGPNLRPVNSGP